MADDYKDLETAAQELNLTPDALQNILKHTHRKVGFSGPHNLYDINQLRLAVADYMRASRPLEQVMTDYDLSTPDGVNSFLTDLPLIVALHGSDRKNPHAELWGEFIEQMLVQRKSVWLPFGTLSVKKRPARNVYNKKLGKTVPCSARTDINLDRAFERINNLFNKEN